jgi:hypothetical protein
MKRVFKVHTESRTSSGFRTDKQFLRPSEFHLIKTMLKDGLRVREVEMVEMDEKEFKIHFG